MDVLKTMLTMVRTRLRDLRVRTFPEYELISFLNEGKNEVVKIIRQADENFFETTTSVTISATTAPNKSSITLPADFATLRNLSITTAGMESTQFYFMSQSDRRFQDAAIAGGSFAGGGSAFYYDFVGLSEIILSPGADVEMACRMDYIRMIPDMMFPSSYPEGVPPEHYDFIVTWAVCEGLRAQNDARLGDYLSKLEWQKTSLINSVNTRQSKEPKFVRGYMEDEGWD
jgi:hypothetical protein